MRFEVTAPPHIRPRNSVTRVMGNVLIGLVPATFVYVWFFGVGLLLNIAVACAAGMAFEYLALRARGLDPARHAADLSVLVTAVLLAFCIPPLMPWWVTVTGMAFAVLFGKHLYGGLGHNPFNPAMVGYVVMLISFPGEMTHWVAPAGAEMGLERPGLGATLSVFLTGALPGTITWEAITAATPLDDLQTQLGLNRMVPEVMAGPLYGSMAGKGWEWVGNAIILGGAWLLWTRTIRWHIPVAFLAGILVPATVATLIAPGSHAGPFFHLFSGGTLLGAFFIATDPVSAATSPKGRLIFAAGIGLITWIIRTYGTYADGVAFAVLLMNMAVPAIDYYTVPRTYGHERRGH